MTPIRKVLIVAAPGNLQAGLQILLAKIPDVETLVVADERSALGAISRQEPALVIVDCDGANNRCPELLGHIKRRWPNLRCIALLSHIDQLTEIAKSGVDGALMKGIPAKKLLAAVETLLTTAEVH